MKVLDLINIKQIYCAAIDPAASDGEDSGPLKAKVVAALAVQDAAAVSFGGAMTGRLWTIAQYVRRLGFAGPPNAF